MAEDLELDLSFLDDFDTSIDAFAERLFHVRVIICDNNDPDIRVLELDGEHGVADYINKHFDSSVNVTQLIVPNGKPDDHDFDMCTHFRIICAEYHSKSPTNYKLEHFLKSAGITGVGTRCRMAMIVAMMGSTDSRHMSVPMKYTSLSIQDLSMFSPIEVYGGDVQELCNIPGMVLPKYLPDELHWNIMKYLRHPCAQLIKNEMERINEYWKMHFELLFVDAYAYLSDSMMLDLL